MGDKVELGDRKAGEVLNVAGNAFLAVASVEKASEELTVGGNPVRRIELPYLIK